MNNRLGFKFWVGIGVSVFFMALLLKKIDFRLLGVALRSVDYRFVLLAIALTFVSQDQLETALVELRQALENRSDAAAEAVLARVVPNWQTAR